MKVALLGAKCLPSAGSINHAVVPFVGLPDASAQSNAAPPHAWTSIPRCCLYQARSATGSFALKKIPPIPVTLFILSLRVQPSWSVLRLRCLTYYSAGQHIPPEAAWDCKLFQTLRFKPTRGKWLSHHRTS